MTALLLPVVLSLPAAASSGGKTGRAASGCGGCHGDTASSAVTVELSAPAASVRPGETLTLTLAVASGVGDHVAFGFNLDADRGTLDGEAPVSVVDGELTHARSLPLADGEGTVTVDWTAPEAVGVVRLRAAGNAVDRDGSGRGDGWGLAELRLLVEEERGGGDADGGGEDSGAVDPGGEDSGTDGGGEDSGTDGGGEDSGAVDPGGEDSGTDGGGEDSGAVEPGGQDSGTDEPGAADDGAADDGAASGGDTGGREPDDGSPSAAPPEGAADPAGCQSVPGPAGLALVLAAGLLPWRRRSVG